MPPPYANFVLLAVAPRKGERAETRDLIPDAGDWVREGRGRGTAGEGCRAHGFSSAFRLEENQYSGRGVQTCLLHLVMRPRFNLALPEVHHLSYSQCLRVIACSFIYRWS